MYGNLVREMKKGILHIFTLLVITGIIGCTSSGIENQILITENKNQSVVEIETESEIIEIKDNETARREYSFIEPAGNTLETRIRVLEGYARNVAEEGSMLEFLRNYPVKEDKSPVLLYDESKKRNQDAHIAVLELPIENADLQQCADSVMRVYAEYFLASGQPERQL